MSYTVELSEFRELVFDELEDYYEETTVGNEIAFENNIGNGFFLRILTSIPEGDYKVRDKGADAIRVHIYNKNDETILESASHTKRTKGFQDRVKEKVDDLVGCNDCEEGQLKVGESDEYGYYFFCPECSYTRNLN